MTRTVQIIDDNETITFLWGVDEVQQDVLKRNIIDLTTISGLSDPAVILKDNNGDSEVIHLSWVTVPVVANIGALDSFLQNILNTNSTTPLATDTFTNADLVAGVLTINHGLGTLYPALFITDPSGGYVGGVTITVVDANSVTVDFGGAIGAGTWTWFIK